MIPHPLAACHRFLAAILVLAGPGIPAITRAGDSPPPACDFQTVSASDPAEAWSFDFESGALWRVSGNTWVDYLVLPQIFSVRTPEHLRLDLGGHDLTVRARFSLLVEPIARGPESLYLAWSASPSLEYWFIDQRACFYASAGGGFGWIDSGGISGGQGQDFTLNWFATTGLRWQVQPGFSLHAGAYFQHLSNGGATDPNPGLDALGPMVGASWSF